MSWKIPAALFFLKQWLDRKKMKGKKKKKENLGEKKRKGKEKP
jgi:hypothetical protein